MHRSQPEKINRRIVATLHRIKLVSTSEQDVEVPSSNTGIDYDLEVIGRGRCGTIHAKVKETGFSFSDGVVLESVKVVVDRCGSVSSGTSPFEVTDVVSFKCSRHCY